jgi:hypothetical protein
LAHRLNQGLEIEDDWRDMSVVDFDLEAHVARFEILKRTSYTSGSLRACKPRARVGIEAYHKWESGSSEWKPKSNNRTATPPTNHPSERCRPTSPSTTKLGESEQRLEELVVPLTTA